MDSDDHIPTFYIGHHDRDRTRVASELVRQAQDLNYDMLTSPITSPHFHARVLTLLSNHLNEVDTYPGTNLAVPTIPSLSPVDTPLAPGDLVSQLLAIASPWIDLSSPDPVIYNLSRQVLELEIAYAAFCGIGNVIIPGPKLHHGKLHGDGITRYAHAIQEALHIGPYIQLSMSLAMMDNPAEEEDQDDRSLGAHARGMYTGLSENEYEKSPVEDSEENAQGTPSSRLSGRSAKFDFFGTWDAWNVIRTVCKYSNRLFVALSLPSLLPPLSVQSRWHSEPLRVLSISKKTFFKNPSGYPCFTPYHQALLTRYMRIRQSPWLLLTDIGPLPGSEPLDITVAGSDDSMFADPPSPTPAEASQTRRRPSQKARDPTPHLTYLRRLQRHQPPRTIIERFGADYQDYLQAPLQPLTDNLESVTYEVFEKDPVKYDQYLLAIQQALCDWCDKGKRASGPDGRIIVAVVGAGRGPLVTRALQASDSTGIPIEMWVVEKNPNAYVLLQRHNEGTWMNRVNLVKSDMRSWKGPVREDPPPIPQPTGYTGQWPPPRSADSDEPSILSTDESLHNPQSPSQTHYPIDILISELLGSFADNELSPECLDGILPLLNPTHGISIPTSYTAHLTPIAAPKLHADIAARATTDPTAPNTPYVVMLHAIDYLSTTSRASPTADAIPTTVPNVLEAWSFSHGPMTPLPADSVNKHNERHARLSFNLRDRAVCHGLAGYFETVLYPSVEMSTATAEKMPYPPAEMVSRDDGSGGSVERMRFPAVELSTNPLTMEEKSPGMMSWFPIFFPLKTPLYTPDASTLTVSIFRSTDNRKVWYEWMVEAWSNLMYAGGGGGGGAAGEKRKVRLGVSEVGSSKSAGCMM